MKHEICKSGTNQYEMVCTSTYYYILVYTSISKYEQVHTGTYMVCTSEWCNYTGFCGKQHDAALLDMVWPSHGSDSEQKQGDPDVTPEDEELFETPDADAMEEYSWTSTC